MIQAAEIRKYLPQYLSLPAQENLFAELKQFPGNIDQRVYTRFLQHEPYIFQGDGLNNLRFMDMRTQTIRCAPGMVISNTCDLDQSNKRLSAIQMVYAPILNLDKYIAALEHDYVFSGQRTKESLNSHIGEIRQQRISHIFYLPSGSGLNSDSLVFFDRVCHCSAEYYKKSTIQESRLFTLSNYGYYLFLLKLSIHFTRIRESVQRNDPSHFDNVHDDYAIYDAYSGADVY